MTAKKKSSDSESEFFTEEANKLIFTWQHVWNDKVTSHLKIGGQDYKVEEKDFTLYKDESDDGGDGYFAMGFEYKINHKWTAIVDFVDESFFYVYPGFRDGNSVIIQGNSKISYTNLGARYYLYDWKSFSLFTTGKVSLYADNTIHTDSGEEELSGFGLSGSMDMYYNWKPNLGIYASGFISRSTFEGDDIEYTKLATGTSFNFVWKL